MEFIVYYIYDDKEATIHARSAKDAAIKFIIKYPRDDDSQIRVEVKKSWTQDDDSIFNTLDLLPEVEIYKSSPIQNILEKIILDDFVMLSFEELIERHPDWLKYTTIDEELNSIKISIPHPIKENSPITIEYEGCDSIESSPCVAGGFDPYDLRRFSGASWGEFWGDEHHVFVADAIDEFVRRITSEEII